MVKVYGLDREKIKQQIIPKAMMQEAKSLGDGIYGIISHSVVIKDNRVIRIIPNNEGRGE